MQLALDAVLVSEAGAKFGPEVTTSFQPPSSGGSSDRARSTSERRQHRVLHGFVARARVQLNSEMQVETANEITTSLSRSVTRGPTAPSR
jgi:hypothetical protein